jgi:two-component system sensor histidine kinase VicK
MTDDESKYILDDSFLGSEENFRSVLLSISDGVYLTDREGTIVLWNQACEKITGYGAADVLGHECSDNILNHTDLEGNELCGSEFCPLHQCMIWNAASTRPLTVLALRHDGSRLVMEVSVAPLRNECREVIGGIEVIRDITGKRELEEAKARFFSGVSHELKTPLTVILGSLEMILEGDTGEVSETQRSFLDDSMEEAWRLGRLIDDLLDLSRIEATEFTVQQQIVDLDEVLEKVVRGFTPEAAKKGLQLELHASPLRFLGDRDRIYQVFANIVSNAVKYTPEGKISITAAGEDGWVVVKVVDSGIGIPESELERIFEHFYRVDDEAAHGEKGSGIGLSVARRIVERHGGEISVESTPGEGSTFTVRIPVSLAEWGGAKEDAEGAET